MSFAIGQRVRAVMTLRGGGVRKGTTYTVTANPISGTDSWQERFFEAVAPTIANDLRLKPQTKTVLRHLRKGQHISPMQALVVYSISRLAPCIHDIRKAGYNVSTEVKRDAQGHKYAQYALVS